MYGISNSQQQGGGGGGAASYKAIKSTLTPSDWQEVAKQPYFVGEDAMQWPIDDAFASHAKRSNDIIGLTSGVDYTMSVTVDGQVYTKTAQMADPSQTGGMKVLIFYFAGVGEDGSIINEDELIAVQIYDDVSAMMPGISSIVLIKAPTTVTSFVITSFTGADFGSSGRATISDSAIKVNSAVTMYTNTSEKIAVGEKTNGNVTLIAPSVPETAISYSLEIVGTDTEGLFELINGYVPEVPSVSSNYDTLSNIPIINKEDISGSGFTPVKNTYYRYTGKEHSEYTGAIYKCIDVGDTAESLELYELASMYDVQKIAPVDKAISHTSTNVSITGSASPYLFTVTDSDIRSYKFVRLYPNDEDTETWLNEHTLSSIIKEERGKFTFKVDTNTLPNTFSITYVIENFM